MAFANPKKANRSEEGDAESSPASQAYFESTYAADNIRTIPDGDYSLVGMYLEPNQKGIVDDFRTGRQYQGNQLHLLLEGKDGHIYNLIEIVTDEFKSLLKETSSAALDKKIKIQNGKINCDLPHDEVPWWGDQSPYATESFPTRNTIRLFEILSLEKLICLTPHMA